MIEPVCNYGPCVLALSALSSDTTCANVNDVCTVCMEDCQTLYDDIISNCDETVSGYIAIATLNNHLPFEYYVQCIATYVFIYNVLFIQPSAEYGSVISNLCNAFTNTEDRCVIAYSAINETCLMFLELGINAACTGTCGNQLATAAVACTSTVSFKIAIHVPSYIYSYLATFISLCHCV